MKKYKINADVVPSTEWHAGLNVELEHGTLLSKMTNITNDNIDLTAKIVIAHLLENPRYYKYLVAMEKNMDKHKVKTSIFL